MNRERRSASFFVFFSMAVSFWEHPSMILDLSETMKKIKNDEKIGPENRKKHSTDQNTEPIHEWRIAFCIIFCALFDGGRLQRWFLDDSGHFQKNVKNREKIVKKFHIFNFRETFP